jgi:hypothetical protein
MRIIPRRVGPLPRAPLPRGGNVEIGANPVAVAHYKAQFQQIKARIMSQPRDHVGALGAALRDALQGKYDVRD